MPGRLNSNRSVWMVTAMARTRRSGVTGTPTTPRLTPKEAALVRVMIEAAVEKKAFPTREQAGALAGYGQGEVARVSASRALSRPHVIEAIQEGVREVAGADVAAMYHTLRNAAVKAPSARDRIAAASKVLDLAGMAGTGQVGPAVTFQLVFSHTKAEDCALMKYASPEQRANLVFVGPDQRQAMQRPALSHMAED